MGLGASKAMGEERLLSIRNDADIKIDLFKNQEGWFHVRWMKVEADGRTVTVKTIGFSPEEMRRILEVVK